MMEQNHQKQVDFLRKENDMISANAQTLVLQEKERMQKEIRVIEAE